MRIHCGNRFATLRAATSQGHVRSRTAEALERRPPAADVALAFRHHGREHPAEDRRAALHALQKTTWSEVGTTRTRSQSMLGSLQGPNGGMPWTTCPLRITEHPSPKQVGQCHVHGNFGRVQRARRRLPRAAALLHIYLGQQTAACHRWGALGDLAVIMPAATAAATAPLAGPWAERLGVQLWLHSFFADVCTTDHAGAAGVCLLVRRAR
mmetsp:Transcript_133286/g.426212  ORF Transcript_133286/g.426212 Transcript_133286/m.426212 type:complete len:210 (+) Transcript_133286:29-658(+)